MAYRAADYPIFIDTQGTQTNPTNSGPTVLADTGAVTSGLTGIYTTSGGGIYEVSVNASSSVDCRLSVQRRNAANSANVGVVPIIRIVAKGSVTVPYRFELLNGERIRVIPTADITGDVEVSIVAQRVA